MRDGTVQISGQGALLTFCSQSLEYLLLPEVKYVEISKEMLERIIRFGASNTPQAISVLDVLLESTLKRKELIQPQLADLIKKSMNSVGSPERQFVSFACAEHSIGSAAFRRMNLGYRYQYVASPAGLYFKSTVESMEAANFVRGKVSVNDAMLFLLLYRKRRVELLKIKGLECLFGHVHAHAVDEVFCVIFDFVAEAITYRTPKSKGERSDIVELVIYLSNLLAERDVGGLVVRGTKIYGRIDAEDVVRDIYLFVCEGRRTFEELGVAVRCMILFGYFHDLNWSLPSGRKDTVDSRRFAINPRSSRNDGAETRTKLEYYMPEGAMDKMLAFCREVPLIDVVNDWNRGTTNFLVKK